MLTSFQTATYTTTKADPLLKCRNRDLTLPLITPREHSSITISAREQEVLHLIAHEHSSKEIAAKLFISYETVNSHRKNIMSKLDVKNTAGMVRVAFEKRLLQLFCMLLFSLGSQLSFGQANQVPAGYAAELKVEIISINGNVDDEAFRGDPELRITAFANASNSEFALNSQCNATLDGIAIPYNPNPGIMVGSHTYQGGDFFSDSLALSFLAHEDDSSPSNCFFNSGDDYFCFQPAEKKSILSLTNATTGGTMNRTIAACSGDWIITFKITVTFIPPTLACLSAQPLVSGQEVTVDLRSAQVDSDNGGVQCDLDSAGLWYTFIGTGREIRIELCEQYSVNNIDPELAILSGSCGNLTCISSAETVKSRCSMIDIMTTVDETYYVHVIKKNETYVDFNLTYLALPPYPVNDECDGATSLNVHDDIGCQSSQPATLYGATKSPTGIATSSFFPERDVWFSFVAEDTSQYIYIDNYDVFFQLFDNDCNSPNPLAIYEEQSSSVGGLTKGSTYYIRAYEDSEFIDEYDEERLDFNICIGRVNPAYECAGAIPLTVGSECSPQLFTFAGSTIGQNECDDPSIWFMLTMPSSGTVVIQTSGPGTSDDTEISAYAGSCSNPIEIIECLDDDTGDDNHELIYIQQAAGTNLLVRIGSSQEMSSFSICVYEPSNSEIGTTSDDCGGAMMLEVGSTCEPTLYTFGGATSNNTNECFNEAGVWFQVVVPPSGNLTFSTLYPGTVEDTRIRAYSGACGSLTDISDGCQDDDNTRDGDHEQITLTEQTPGVTLYIVVSDDKDDRGTFSVCAYDPGSVTVPSDDCIGATMLSVGSTCEPSLYTFEGANNDVGECSSDAGVWFKIIIPASGNLAFSTLYPGTVEDTEISVYSGACGSLIDIGDACQDDDNTSYDNHEQIFLTGQTPGDILHILVSDNRDDGGTFSVCAHDGTDPAIERPTSDECPEATLLTVGSICEPTLYTFDGASDDEDDENYECGEDGVWFQLVIPLSGNLLFTTLSPGTNEDTEIRVYGGTCGSFTDISNGCQDENNTIYDDHEQILITGQTPGDTIYIVVIDKDNGGTFSVCAYEISDDDLGVSAADDCAGAMELAVGNTCVPSLYNFIGATNSPDECSGDGVWFKVVVPISGNLIFKTLFPGTTFDTRIKIYEGTCGDFTLLSQDCQDDNNTEDGDHERIILSGLSPGSMLYIVVEDRDDLDGGTFSVCAVDPTAADLGESPSDDCAGATLLTVGSACQPSLYNFNGATHGPFECRDNGVWFKVVVPSSGDLFFSTFLSETIGTSVDTEIKVYGGTCGNFLLLSEDCQDNDNTGFEDHEQINLSGLTPGETLYILVDDNGEGGTFRVCASSNLDNDNCTNSDIDVNLAQIAFSQDSTYKTINTITSGVKLNAYGAFIFRAPQSIDLRNNFEVPVGIELKAEIGPCN